MNILPPTATTRMKNQMQSRRLKISLQLTYVWTLTAGYSSHQLKFQSKHWWIWTKWTLKWTMLRVLLPKFVSDKSANMTTRLPAKASFSISKISWLKKTKWIFHLAKDHKLIKKLCKVLLPICQPKLTVCLISVKAPIEHMNTLNRCHLSSYSSWLQVLRPIQIFQILMLKERLNI